MTATDDRAATHLTLYIATADQVIDQFTSESRRAFAWVLVSDAGETIERAESAGKPPRQGSHVDELVPRLVEALGKCEDAATIYIISDVSFFVDKINEGADGRIASGYRRKDKKPLAYAEDWKRFDILAAAKCLSISAGPPRDEKETRKFNGLKDWAKKCARNIGRTWSEWEVR